MAFEAFGTFEFAPTGALAAYAIPLPDRLSRSAINVKEFGAVGDGETDDTAAIQAAFYFAFGDYTNPNGQAAQLNKEVYFPAGKYKITSMLDVRGLSGGWIHGAGCKATRLIYKGPIAASDGEERYSPRTILFRTNGFARMVIEDMSFEMTGLGKTVPTEFAKTFTDATVCFEYNWDDCDPVNTTGCWWVNCSFSGATYGMGVGREYYDQILGTSTTTNTLGPVASCSTSLTMTPSATFSLTTQTGKSAFFPVGAIIEVGIHDPGDPPTTDPSNPIMRGVVVSYNNGTGALVFNTLSDPQSVQNTTSGEVHPVLPGTPWTIWQCRKTFTVAAGLEHNFPVNCHITPMVSSLNNPVVSSFDRPRVVSYNNTTGQLVLNTSAFDGYSSYYDSAGVYSNWTSDSPASVTASGWSFRHWWGFECDVSSWLNCTFEDCYIGLTEGNYNAISCQFLGGRFSRCSYTGFFNPAGQCQSIIGTVFEDNGTGFGVDPVDTEHSFCDYQHHTGAVTAVVGCHSNSKNFVVSVSAPYIIMGCRHDNPNPGKFFRSGGAGAGTKIDSCYSSNGYVQGNGDNSVTICDSTIATNGWVQASTFITEYTVVPPVAAGGSLTFDDLPGSDWLPQGLLVSINDASIPSRANIGAVLFGDTVAAGGGAYSVSIHWNGTAWKVAGK